MPISAFERYGPDKKRCGAPRSMTLARYCPLKNQNDGRPCLFLRGRFFLLGEELYEVA